MIDRGYISIATTSDLDGEVEVRRSHYIGNFKRQIHSVMTFTPEEAIKVRDALDYYIKVGADEQKSFKVLLSEIGERLRE